MTRWLQASPRELATRTRRFAACEDNRTMEGNAMCRALMHACADMIDREIVDDPYLPLHWSLADRIRDAWACFRGRAVVLRCTSQLMKAM